MQEYQVNGIQLQYKIETAENRYLEFYNIENSRDRWGGYILSNLNQKFLVHLGPLRNTLADVHQNLFRDITYPRLIKMKLRAELGFDVEKLFLTDTQSAQEDLIKGLGFSFSPLRKEEGYYVRLKAIEPEYAAYKKVVAALKTANQYGYVYVARGAGVAERDIRVSAPVFRSGLITQSEYEKTWQTIPLNLVSVFSVARRGDVDRVEVSIEAQDIVEGIEKYGFTYDRATDKYVRP